MNYKKIEYKCECCGKKFTNGAIIPNKPANKNVTLCEDCYADIEVYTMIHTPITEFIKILQKAEKKEAE